MTWIIGTDEAGYGPNFGPLVITATVWQLSPAEAQPAWSSCLAEIDRLSPSGLDAYVGDSKRWYTPGGGLAGLERGVLAMLPIVDGRVHDRWTWRLLLQRLDPGCVATLERVPWYVDYDTSLPLDAPLATIAAATEHCRAGA
jgi:hypothetical protein